MRVLLSMLLTFFLVSCASAPLQNISSIPVLDFNSESVMYINGIIGQEHKNSICKNLRKHKNICKKRSEIKYLVLDSPGGDMQIAYNIALMVRFSDIITVIPKNGICASACTVIFQAAKERHASKNSSLLYHGTNIDTKVMEAYFE